MRPPPASGAPNAEASDPVTPLTLELTSIKVPRDLALPPLDIESELSDISIEVTSSFAAGGVEPNATAASKRAAVSAAPTRDTAPSAGARGRSGSSDEGQTLLHDLDAAFGAMVGSATDPRTPSEPSKASSKSPHDTPADVHELFSALAANHMRQVRDFVIGLHWNEPVAEWHAICQPAITSLLGAAKQLESAELCASLEAFDTAMRQAGPEGRNLSEASRQSLIDAYKRLAKQLPDTFSLDAETGRRETIIVHSLLQQIPEVTKVTVDKLYAAGLSKLEFFVAATPEEIVQTTGILPDVAGRIVQKFREYRRVALTQDRDGPQSSDRKRLAQLSAALRQLDEAFERAADGWSNDAVSRKREVRRQRADAYLEIKIVLARLGELACLSELDKMSFKEKIAYLERFLRMTTPPQAPTS